MQLFASLLTPIGTYVAQKLLIISLLTSLLWAAAGVLQALGLWDPVELIFNLRGGVPNGFMSGIFHPTMWEKSSLVFFYGVWVTSASALAGVIMYAALKYVYAGGAVASKVRASDMLWRMVASVALLVFAPKIFHGLLSFNDQIVEWLWSVNKPYADLLAQGTTPFTDIKLTEKWSTDQLLKPLYTLVYLYILLRLNILYIIRFLLVNALLILSPVVSVISMAAEQRGIIARWGSELASNIFMQSAHALVLGMVLRTLASCGDLPPAASVVVCSPPSLLIGLWALIPLAAQIKALVTENFMAKFAGDGAAGEVHSSLLSGWTTMKNAVFSKQQRRTGSSAVAKEGGHGKGETDAPTPLPRALPGLTSLTSAGRTIGGLAMQAVADVAPDGGPWSTSGSSRTSPPGREGPGGASGRGRAGMNPSDNSFDRWI